ncbi:hypothetical protein B0H17DRAFT_1176698 [Mycena rosella]|uniref:Uncharacterized protein n=1 Tax=Mycena rosella TaxID=1033263 RepID=A0AAD7DYE7_MYCRO|nr:hypothetical protein B0H17DRAFT_1176698 [Mycena rosella]
MEYVLLRDRWTGREGCRYFLPQIEAITSLSSTTFWRWMSWTEALEDCRRRKSNILDWLTGIPAALRLIPGKIPWAAYLIFLVEFAERASYYGCNGVFSLPLGGNGAGAPPVGTQETAGRSFLAYTLPAIGIVAHVVLIIDAIPSVIAGGHAIAPFVIGILLLALSTGFVKVAINFSPYKLILKVFRSCIAPIIAGQSVVKVQSVTTLSSGERVVIDPGSTIQSMLMMDDEQASVLAVGTTRKIEGVIDPEKK